ncbi:MAG: hypothetical protein K5924_08085 [Chloroflexi bacterium]|nr:hypothetical protein [Chloroflexota bacterium]
MGRIEVRSLSDPDEVVGFDHGESRIVRLAGTVVSEEQHDPGWSWETHIRPVVGGTSCQFHHRGYMRSGVLVIRSDEGEEVRIGPGAVVDIQPGHVGWVEGEEPVLLIDWGGAIEWASPRTEGERILATILFTDIVDSTATASRLGDSAWRRTLELHNETVRMVLQNYRGREVATAGDGFLVIFDGAARAIRCGVALARAVEGLDLRIRVGIHTGEVELANDNLTGVAVHATARIMNEAGPGEVLVSATTRLLAEGAGLQFEPRGAHHLKGLDGEHELFAAEVVPAKRPMG